MGVASIRLDDELLASARKYSINLSEAARTGIQEAVRRQRMLESGRILARHAVKPVEPSQTTIRRLRDG